MNKYNKSILYNKKSIPNIINKRLFANNKMVDKKEIKLKIDSRILDIANEYEINLQECLSSAILKKVNKIKERKKQEELFKKLAEQHNEQAIIKIIKRMSKQSKFKYATLSSLYAEAEQEMMNKKEVDEVVDRLMARKEIYKPIDLCYRVAKVKPSKY